MAGRDAALGKATCRRRVSSDNERSDHPRIASTIRIRQLNQLVQITALDRIGGRRYAMKTWDKASLGPFDAGGGHKTERPDLGDCSG